VRVRLLICSFVLFIAGLIVTAQGQVGQTTPPGGLFPGPAGCTAATNLLARMDASENASAVTTAVCTIAQITNLDFFHVLAINSTTNAKLNWLQNAFNITTGGTVTFTANSGYNGDASTGFLNTNYTASTAAGTHWTMNSASMGICDLTANSSSTFLQMGGQEASTALSAIELKTTNFLGGLNSNNSTGSEAISSTKGSFAVVRTGGTTVTLYQNGTSLGTPATSSNSLTNVNLYVLGYNNNGTLLDPTSDLIAYDFGGGSLTSGNITTIYNTMHTYLSAVGAPSGC
jgi:hypothetical protein